MNMNEQTNSPAISSFSWGRVETSEGHVYKDVKLFPGGSREWDWNETGTHHKPGILPADIRELIKNDAEIIILSKGVYKRLQTSSQAIEYLEEENIPYHILQTEAAVTKYNNIITDSDKMVGALIHSTC